jgi:hypothetical protein
MMVCVLHWVTPNFRASQGLLLSDTIIDGHIKNWVLPKKLIKLIKIYLHANPSQNLEYICITIKGSLAIGLIREYKLH